MELECLAPAFLYRILTPCFLGIILLWYVSRFKFRNWACSSSLCGVPIKANESFICMEQLAVCVNKKIESHITGTTKKKLVLGYISSLSRKFFHVSDKSCVSTKGWENFPDLAGNSQMTAWTSIRLHNCKSGIASTNSNEITPDW